MNKFIFLIFITIGLFCFACENDCDCKEISDTLEAQKLIGYLALEQGLVIEVEEEVLSVNKQVNAIIPISINELAVSECDPFGLGGDYVDLCRMNGTKGRALAKMPAGEDPASSDIYDYTESNSVEQPEDFSPYSFTYFSKKPEHFPFYTDDSYNTISFRNSFGALGAGWNNARVDWCTVGNHPERCVQE